jgi:SAM-dependent methyltransferase
VVERDYAELECEDCSLGYCEPMEPGGAAFYDWLYRAGEGHADGRWEFAALERILRSQLRPGTVGVDVGCGSGAFMERLRGIDGVRFLGLDTDEAAVRAGKARGLDLRTGTFAQFVDSMEEDDRPDVVTSFHCVEHVRDPLGLVRTMLDAVRPGGSVYFSVPLTPQALELSHFLPRNHPPHHLTRWTPRALERLAEACGASLAFTFAPVLRNRLNALYSVAYGALPRERRFDQERWLGASLARPVEFLRCWSRLRSHVRVAGPLHDGALCRLRRAS